MSQFAEIGMLVPGATNLSADEWAAIHRFTLLWTLFEAQVLETHASVGKITKKVQALPPGVVVVDWFRDQLKYFSDRYIEAGSTNHYFTQLHLNRKDRPLVKAVLTGESKEPANQLIACLAIVYRFRNNFFHGLKWAYCLKNQLDNFTHSSDLIVESMRRFPRNST